MDESDSGEMEDAIQERSDTGDEGMEAEKPPEWVIVKILHPGVATVVQWIDKSGDYHCGYVPKDALAEGDDGPVCPEDVLAAATPYGFNWDKLPESISLQGVRNDLNMSGIYTQRDLERKLPEVKKIAQLVATQILRAIIKVTKET